MMKHATINRTCRAQQTLQLQRHWQQQDQQQLQLGCNQERERKFSTTSSSATSTPTKKCNSSIATTTSPSSQGSMIKIFAQTLGQDVEYITLHVNTQTKSQQIIKTLLRKFRLKHRDPNLFHLTLERWIRKDGLKFKSVMLLGDEACPLQLQQCCSNPPHDDIKFTLQKRSGTLVKIYCSDVVPDAKYKCLPLSTQTTVEETIELVLYCLNLASQSNAKPRNLPISLDTHHHQRTFSASPNSSSICSSSSDTSSSSGIELEPNNENNKTTEARLDSDSRASSVTSISSSSNVSSLSSNLVDQYCLVIECADNNFKRVLHPDEYLVDVYQGLLAEANKTAAHHVVAASSENLDIGSKSPTDHVISPLLSVPAPTKTLLNQSSDQWFFIKLKRRYESTENNNHLAISTIGHVNPRQSMPLPPIPVSLFKEQQMQTKNILRQLVSTTQIEINRPGGSNTATGSSQANNELMREIMSSTPITLASQSAQHLAAATATIATGVDKVDSLSHDDHQAPPPIILLSPPVKPRRRNLSNASSTFGRPLIANNRRRYDPAQLAEDLDQLNIAGGTSNNGSVMAPVATGD